MPEYEGNYPAGGTFGKGFQRKLRAVKREEAERRDAKTPPERKSKKAKKGQS
jgi:hypothetical protein